MSKPSPSPKRKRTTAKKTSSVSTSKPRSRTKKGSSKFSHKHRIVLAVFVGAFFGVLSYFSLNPSVPSYADTTIGPMVGIGGKCLDNSRNTLANSNPVQLWDCNGGNAQKWAHTTSGAIKNQNLNYCLDVRAAGKTSGTIVQLYTCNGTAAQVWKPQADGSLVNPNSGLCLDDKYGITKNGNPITIYTCNSTAAQNWKLPANKPANPYDSGQAMPVGDLTGWKQIMAEDFKTNSDLGNFQAAYQSDWCGYNESGKYFNSKVISAHDGVMDFKLDGKLGAAGSFGPGNLCHGQQYGRFSMRLKVVGAADNGTAIMVWPSSNVWGDGEIDYPEGNFDKTMHVFHHGMGCTQCGAADGLDTGASWQSWHTVTVEWVPTSVKYYLDGSLIKTVTHDVPKTNHRFTIQMAPNGNNPKPGNFLIDWVTIYSRS